MTPTAPPDDLVDLPGFKPGRKRPSRQDPLDPEATTVTGTDPETGQPMTARVSDLDGDDFGPGWMDGEQDEAPSSTWTTTPSQVFTAKPEAFEPILGTAFEFTGLALHQRRTPGDNVVWIVHPDERDAVVKPLSRILSRHAPLHTEAAGDVLDGIEAAVAGVGYTVENLQAERVLAAELAKPDRTAQQ